MSCVKCSLSLGGPVIDKDCVCCGWQHFQELEEEHICQMKDFVDTYVKAWENQHVLLGQVGTQFFFGGGWGEEWG